ncbi:hypothetical protein [Streptomyces sp. NPDC001774]
MADTIPELSKELSTLRDILLSKTKTENVTVTYAKEKEEDQKPQTFSVSEFKHALIEQSPRIVTDSLLPYDFAKRFAEMHEELIKAPWSEWMEAAGLDGFAAAVEKISEGKDFWTVLPYAIGAFVGLAVPALAVYLGGKFNQFSRDFREAISRDGLIRGYDANGDLTRQNRQDIEARERRVANGGTSLADIPETANFDNLRNQLTTLNPHLEKFNDLAPAFIREFRKLPSESKATKAANGVKKIAEAVAQVEHTTMQPVATGIGAIKDAVATADPRKITKVAQAVGKLKGAMDGFEPTRLPDATNIQGSADAMKNLARETGTLRTKLREFASTVRTLDDVIGTATG